MINPRPVPVPRLWLQTQSGRAFPLLRPTAADVLWADIAVSLARLCRFNGHTEAFYSVAQHCLGTADLIAQALAGDRGLGVLMRAVTPAERLCTLHGLIHQARQDGETARQLYLAALLHDAHEAYIGDIATPVAGALAFLAGLDSVKALKGILDPAIHEAAGLPRPLPPAWTMAIGVADRVMLATERRDLLADGPVWDQPLPTAAPARIIPLAEHRASEQFLGRLRALLPA